MWRTRTAWAGVLTVSGPSRLGPRLASASGRAGHLPRTFRALDPDARPLGGRELNRHASRPPLGEQLLHVFHPDAAPAVETPRRTPRVPQAETVYFALDSEHHPVDYDAMSAT